MRRVDVRDLSPGDRIGQDVLATVGALPLLRAGVRVSDQLKRSLERAGITSVWIDDDLSAGIEPSEQLSEATKQQTVAAIREAFLDPSKQLKRTPSLSDRAVADMQEAVERMVQDVMSNADVAIALNDLANADAYTLKHSLSVATLGLALGARVMQTFGWVDAKGARRLDSVAARLPALGLGLILHDIGKVAIPREILHKPSPLTEEEMAVVRKHPMIGVQMLQRADISPLTRAVVREHHERWNGNGYPDRKAGADIHQFARVAAVADVFDALASDRVYRAGDPVNEVYDFIISRTEIDFDPEVVSVFRASVAPYPTGTSVVLSDGAKGIVSAVHEKAVTTPVVRVLVDGSGAAVAPREVDLSKSPALTITSVCAGNPFKTFA